MDEIAKVAVLPLNVHRHHTLGIDAKDDGAIENHLLLIAGMDPFVVGNVWAVYQNTTIDRPHEYFGPTVMKDAKNRLRFPDFIVEYGARASAKLKTIHIAPIERSPIADGAEAARIHAYLEVNQVPYSTIIC
jgi:hypothetical protein